VFDKTVEDSLNNEVLEFPCGVHKDDIMAYIIRYYLNLRMRQWTRQTNRKIIKTNMMKKKISKFYTT